MIYRYRRQLRGNDVRYLPLLTLDLHHAKRHLRVRALLDSGAEHTIFSTRVAEALGIEAPSGRLVTLRGIGGTMPGYLAAIELQLGASRWTTDAIFADGIAADSGLLGQLGFFQFFTVTFRYQSGEIDIRRAHR
jgi:hypothetical protein